MSLDNFVEDLAAELPEARLDMTRPAQTPAAAMERADALCEFYAGSAGCEKDLENETEYLAYLERVSTIIGSDTQKTKRILEHAAIGAVVLDLLVAEGMFHTADAAALAADLGAHGVDLVEAGFSVGLSLVASMSLAFFFKQRNAKKTEAVALVTEQVFLKGRLAKALMTAGQTEMAADVLQRLQSQTSAA